jgi:uncharacterized protein YndB with AHSA1/START domain
MEKATRITVAAEVNSPVSKVWEVWNAPDHIVKWNSADPSWHTPSSENDLRVGGKFKNRMEARDGSFGFDFEGTYDQVLPDKEISYTMGDGRKATTIFSERDGKTVVTTTFDPENQHDPEFQRQGWQAILNNFVHYVESQIAG